MDLYEAWLQDANNKAQNDHIARLECKVQQLQLELNSTRQALKQLIDHVQFLQQLNGQGRAIQLDELIKVLSQPATDAELQTDSEAYERAVKPNTKLDHGQW